MTQQHIAIIGGGVAGSLLAWQLARQPGGPLSVQVTVVEPRPRLGPGTAYSTEYPEWLLNVRNSGLSALPDEPDHFRRWLQATGLPAAPDEFSPRLVFGRYVESLLAPLLHAPAANGLRLRWCRTQATAAHRIPAGWQLTLADGGTLTADVLVLAQGNFAPPPPVQPAAAYWHHPRFHANPWAPGALAGISLSDSVLFIGTGLTTLDALVALQARGHRGPLVAVSRHGHWPMAHALKPAPPYPSFYSAELAGLHTVLAVLRVVRRHVATAEAAGYCWRAVIDSLRPDLGRIWAAWPLAEQARFLRHLAARWTTWRHRNPPTNAAVLQELLASGQLRVQPGRVRAIEPDATGGLTVQLMQHDQASWLRADHVLLCTGPQLDYQQVSDPLVASLRAAGLLQPDALHLGLSTDAQGALLDAAGQRVPHLYTLGPSLRPLWFESTAVPEIRQQAAQLAALLLQRRS